MLARRPVSTTHAVIGGVVGGTWGAVGWDCLNWSFVFGDLCEQPKQLHRLSNPHCGWNQSCLRRVPHPYRCFVCLHPASSLSGIVLSWVISPIFSGCVGAATYLITKKLIFDNDKVGRFH